MVSDDVKPKRLVGSWPFKFVLVILSLAILVTLGFMIANKVSTSDNPNRNVDGSGVNTAAPSSLPKAKSGATGCITESFTVGSSGNCVTDIQTMVDYMESEGLTECPFTGGALLTIEGKYDQTTADQIKVIQSWEDCYNKQEGGNSNIAVNGNVNGTTWDELCTYSYHYPQAANSGLSIYRQASINAGKDAGCAQLF